MCGFTGFWDPQHSTDHAAQLARMTASIAHRGPDADGVWHDAQAGIALGHRRLAIIDLSPLGAQPMHTPDERYTLVFNGEIYNYLALRQQLQAQGVQFRSESDTEVLLALIAHVGCAAALQQAVGMFAFALWDRDTQTLTLARDRFGEKPLYYGLLPNGTFTFGSELKSVIAGQQSALALDPLALQLYLQLGYIPAPASIYAPIKKLPPGAILQVDRAQLSARQLAAPAPYWRLREHTQRSQSARSTQDVQLEFESLLQTAIQGQMLADVPLGAFLSGGIDSSLVVATMQQLSANPVRTFTIGFGDDSINEAPYAKQIAQHLGTEHTELYVNSQQAQALVAKLPAIFDEPFADPSALPTYFVAQLARQQVTVALSGDGGDELLGGYLRYQSTLNAWQSRAEAGSLKQRVLQGLGQRSAGLPGKYAAKLERYAATQPVNKAESFIEFYLQQISRHWLPNQPRLQAADMVSAATYVHLQSGLSNVDQMLLFDSLTYLPGDILAKVDRTAMAHSLETRVPFLDHRIAEFIWALPADMVRLDAPKQLFRTALNKHVPAAMFERPKQGFGIPLAAWLRTDLADLAADTFASQAWQTANLIPQAVVQRRFTQHRNGQTDWSRFLWRALQLALWVNHAQR